MLKILINNGEQDVSQYISNVSAYFDNEFENEWFEDDFVKKIIKTIDDTEVRSGLCFYHEAMGSIPLQWISSGSKGLILLYKEDVKINGDRFGDNCLELLLEIADTKDIEISLSHLAKFSGEFEAEVIDWGTVHNFKEFLDAYGDIVYGY